MRDDREYFQRQAEDEVYLPEGVRATLAIFAMLAGACLVIVGAMFIGDTGTKLPGPAAATLVGITIILLGIGSAYVGIRLLLLPSAAAHLLGSRGTRIAGYFVAFIGVLNLAGGIFLGNLYISAGGLFGVLMGYWLYTSAKRIRD